MSILLEDRPVLSPETPVVDTILRPQGLPSDLDLSGIILPETAVPEAAPQGFARWMLRAYMSSFNVCLSELGWVPKRILEIGCGDGSMLSYVGQTFMDSEVVGVTFGPRSAEQARSKTCCRIHFEEADPAERLPFKDNDFDVVIAHGWLADSPMPHHWVREMARVSAEGIIVSALHPVGQRWGRFVPGAKQAQLTGQSVFGENRGTLPAHRLAHWLSEAGCPVEAKTYPMPYTMLMARKPQLQAARA